MSKPASAQPIPPLDPVHDGRHVLGAGPLERESIPYVIALPEHRLAAFVYTWVTREHRAGSLCVVYGPALGASPVVEAVDGIDVGPDRNFNDWNVGALHLRQDLKLETAELSVRGNRAQLDARFEAMHPAYAYGSHVQGCPDYAATNRLEQAGRMKGILRVDGQEYRFDTTAARDHSWGTRDWQTPQHWKWLHAQAGPDTSVHFWEINARGRTDLRGYVFRDGVMAEVSHVDVGFTHDEAYRQTHITARVRDREGRTTQVVGDFYAHFPLLPAPHTTLNESAMRCEIDGRAGVGWCEFMWPTDYLVHLRARKSDSAA